MKNKKIIILATVILSSIAFMLMTSQDNPDAPNEEILLPEEIIIPEEIPVTHVEAEGDIENSLITFEQVTSQYIDENNEILINTNLTVPKSEGLDEFAQTFNTFYEKVLTKAQNFEKYEGADLADQEKEYYKDDFFALNYISVFEIMFEDENLISIRRETTMYSNETDFFEINTETFSKEDGSLILITDICPEILQNCNDYFQTSLATLENFRFSITSNGIWCRTDEFDGLLPYNEMDLEENYKYLGENDATD